MILYYGTEGVYANHMQFYSGVYYKPLFDLTIVCLPIFYVLHGVLYLIVVCDGVVQALLYY